ARTEVPARDLLGVDTGRQVLTGRLGVLYRRHHGLDVGVERPRLWSLRWLRLGAGAVRWQFARQGLDRLVGGQTGIGLRRRRRRARCLGGLGRLLLGDVRVDLVLDGLLVVFLVEARGDVVLDLGPCGFGVVVHAQLGRDGAHVGELLL